MISVQIEQHQQRTWHPLPKGWWSGHIYYDNHWLSSTEISQYLAAITSATELSTLLQQWNGSFALIWQTGKKTFAAVDIARSIPLFWSVQSGEICLTNHLSTQPGPFSSWQNEKGLVQSEFLPGHNTLLANWQQLQAGEILEVNYPNCFLHNYFPHRRPAAFTLPPSVLKQQFAELLEQQIDRLISFAAGREIVIPLSGGYDSRILLTILRHKQYPALKAFTYGQEGSWEVQLAQSVAARLEVDWKFVPYSSTLLQKFGDQQWQAYAGFAGQYTSLPQEQDYFALRQLQAQGWLKEGSVICPGYCGDFQAGSYLPDGSLLSRFTRLTKLQKNIYQRFIRYPSPANRQHWQRFLPQNPINSQEEYISELEHWVLREYVSKFIVNGVRAYEWFNCSWYLPLWDLEFIRFWQGVPNTLRQNMALYREVLEQEWFEPYQLMFPEDQLPTSRLRTLSRYFPQPLINILKKIRSQKPTTNINGLHQLVPYIQKLLGWPELDLTKSVNEMIGHWYHHQIQQQNEINTNH